MKDRTPGRHEESKKLLKYAGEANEIIKSALKIRNTAPFSLKLTKVILMV